MLNEIDVSGLEKTLNKAIEAIENSKKQIYEIARSLSVERELTINRLSQLDNVAINEYYIINQKAELGTRLDQLQLTLDRIEMLNNEFNTVFPYTSDDLSKITEVIESAQKRQMFGLKIIQAQEEERKRVAKDIHDGPAQTMANVVLRAEIAERLLADRQVEQAVKELKDLKLMVRDSLVDVRQIIFNLRPMALDDLGLLPTLRKYFQEVSKRAGLNIELRFTGKEKRLSSCMEVAIFRLIQEIISNIVKHAKATYAQAVVEYNDRYIKVMIQDNGIGFNEEEALRNNNNFGLIGMKERVELLEGEFSIYSIKNNGTSIMFKIPISEGEEIYDEFKKN